MFEQREGYGPPTPVEIFQWEAEFNVLLDIYRERAPLNVLEIGTYHGGTLYHWLQNAAFGATITSLDSYAVGVDNRALYSSWKPDGVDLNVLKGDSHDPRTVKKVAALGPFDWLFIDAGHLEHEVRADWELYNPMVSSGGLIVLHDILPANEVHPEIQVDPVWQEIQRQGFWTREIVADPDAWWGGIGCALVP